ncbi:flagellar filament capping protein FliD [Vulgatibacter sp.]|uniref:flagellar filament capping protein FliD n=1 Tax=Vulgatibacter sp. TaxID=1971226 RepID=UPI0035641E7A
MAIFTGGLASGIDSGLIIDQLVALRSKSITQIKQRQAAFSARVSAFGTLASKLSGLGDAAAALANEGVGAVKTAGTHAAFSVEASAGAEAGRYAVVVEQLATAARLRSAAHGSAAAPITAGTLQLQVRGESFDVEIVEGATLADVARAITASGAPVGAVILNDGTRSHLSLTNRETGHPIGTAPDDALVITQTLTGSTGSPLFAIDPANPSAPAVFRASAANARLQIDGLAIERTSNTIDDVIPGATLALLRPSAQEAGVALSEDLVLVADLEGSRSRIDTFVDAYNALVQSLRKLNAPADGSVGLLTGDGTARGLQSELEAMLSQVAGSGALRTLADLGIELQRDGTLQLDAATFEQALASHSHGADTLFSSSGPGIGGAVEALVDRYTDPEVGILTTRQDGLDETVKRLAEDIERQNDSLEIFRQTLIRQFTALERTVSRFNAIGAFLDQQEAAREQK